METRQNSSIIGIDLGGTNVRVGLVQDGTILKSNAVAIKSKGTEQEVIDQIEALIDVTIDQNVAGIGIGVPSVVDVEKGIVYDTQNIPSWKEVHLKSIFEKKYNIPVYLNNDANCFVLGEKYFGKAKSYHSVVGLIVGTGLGAGIIINNKLYSGPNCGAGEFGMIPYKDQIFEYYCCGQYFPNVHGVSGDVVAKKAEAGDQEALDIFDQFGKHFGNAVQTILYAVDPEIIILGGSVRKSFKFFEKSMWESLDSFAYSQTVKNLKIQVSEMDQIAILGAAALYFDAQI